MWHSTDNYGKSVLRNDYFWKEIHDNYPALWEALYRIKLYRHAYDHRKLNEKPHEDFIKFVQQDLEGQSASQIKELNFLIQQCILDGLFTGIQIESNKLSS